MTALAPVAPAQLANKEYFTSEQVELIKRQIARGCTDDELKLFLYQCQRTGLDPFSKQIYAIKRGDRMTIQTAIDGYRVIADRTGRYAPGPEPRFELDDKGHLVRATATVKKMTADGTWHIVEASADWLEYVATDRNGRPTGVWSEKPRVMLAKCAESLALRKAFPAELSGIYTAEEMDQSNGRDVEVAPQPVAAIIEEPRPSPPSRPQHTTIKAEPPPPPAPPPTAKPDPLATRPMAQAQAGVAKASPAQVKFLNIAITQNLGIHDRDEKLRWISGMLGFHVASSKDIPAGRISSLIRDAEGGVVPNDWAAIASGGDTDMLPDLPEPGSAG